MASVSAQVRFSTPSGAMVNTFHFFDTATLTYPTHADNVNTALTNFYNGGGAASIGALMAGWVSRSVEVRTYNPLDSPPRVPRIYTFTLPATATGASNWSTPADVALCMSFHAAPPITRRKRGRVYIGGAQASWFVAGSTTTLPTLATGAATITFACNLAATTLAAAAVGWSVYSRVSNAYFPVVGGHVDSEPDTQRRRGNTTTTRTTWGV
jgi:hypothetical protein